MAVDDAQTRKLTEFCSELTRITPSVRSCEKDDTAQIINDIHILRIVTAKDVALFGDEATHRMYHKDNRYFA